MVHVGKDGVPEPPIGIDGVEHAQALPGQDETRSVLSQLRKERFGVSRRQCVELSTSTATSRRGTGGRIACRPTASATWFKRVPRTRAAISAPTRSEKRTAHEEKHRGGSGRSMPRTKYATSAAGLLPSASSSATCWDSCEQFRMAPGSNTIGTGSARRTSTFSLSVTSFCVSETNSNGGWALGRTSHLNELELRRHGKFSSMAGYFTVLALHRRTKTVGVGRERVHWCATDEAVLSGVERRELPLPDVVRCSLLASAGCSRVPLLLHSGLLRRTPTRLRSPGECPPSCKRLVRHSKTHAAPGGPGDR